MSPNSPSCNHKSNLPITLGKLDHYSINDWSNINICQLMDEQLPQNVPHDRWITFVKDRPDHDWRYAIDATKIKQALDWQPEEIFESGIQKTVDWYLVNG